MKSFYDYVNRGYGYDAVFGMGTHGKGYFISVYKEVNHTYTLAKAKRFLLLNMYINNLTQVPTNCKS